MCKMYKVVETDASPRQRSVLQLVKDLLILSRFYKYNPWLAVFSGGMSLPYMAHSTIDLWHLSLGDVACRC
jgi:hypothetical protein